MEFETVIGLEVHIQLNTQSKVFSAASTEFGKKQNSCVDAFSLALPGVLPVFNVDVLKAAILLGLATKSKIRRKNSFARKHYFYPDLPKGYQITQFSEPICEGGEVPLFQVDNFSFKSIGLVRIHIEEDAGKNIHKKNYSLVDYNRAGVPLLEVVSKPEISSPQEAAVYLRSLRQIVRYLGISDGNMEEGSLRCDTNISLRPKGETQLGVRTEIKNINSFNFVEKALIYEAKRQKEILLNGKSIIQETRFFDASTGRTESMRTKEEAVDYRYIPEPDLPPILITDKMLQSVILPKLPNEYFSDLTTKYGIRAQDVLVLLAEKEYIDFFLLAAEKLDDKCKNIQGIYQILCNWLTSELFGLLKKYTLDIMHSPINAESLARLVGAIALNEINTKQAKSIFEKAFTTGQTINELLTNIQAITSEEEIKTFIEGVITTYSDQWQIYKNGKDTLRGFFVGKILQVSSGRINPVLIQSLLEKMKDVN